MRRFFLILACFILGCQSAFSQDTLSEEEKDHAYWESVLDAYAAFVDDAVLVRENKASAEILRLHQERIARLLQHRRGRMTPGQQARFNAISARYGGREALPFAPPPLPDASPAKPAPGKANSSVQIVKLPERTFVALEEPRLSDCRPEALIETAGLPSFNPSQPVSYCAEKTDYQTFRFLLLAHIGWAPEWNAGFKAGLMHPSGWGGYGVIRMRPSLGVTTPYTLDTEDAFHGSGAYFTGHFYATAGVLKQWGRPILYAGAGYGYRSIYWQDNSGGWAKVLPRSVSGLELEAGAILPFGPVCIDAGLTTLSFRTFGFVIGAGIYF